MTITSDSVDYTQKLVINGESEAFLYRGDELSRAYDIKFENPEWLDKKVWVFYPKKGSPVQSYISNLKNGKLTLSPNCYDCYTLYFERR